MGSNILRRPFARNAAAFSLIELIVALSIIGLLATLVVTAVQSARESARRATCQSNLHEIGAAIAAYESSQKRFPDGGDIQGFSFHVALLPYLEQQPLFMLLQTERKSQPVSGLFISESQSICPEYFACPSDPGNSIAGIDDEGRVTPEATSYHGNCGTGLLRGGFNGMFQYGGTGSPRRKGDLVAGMITDGLSNTAAVSEALVGDWSGDPMRTIYNTRESISNMDEFEQLCLDSNFWVEPGNIWQRGRPWTSGNVSFTMYNHTTRPNNVACYNGTSVQRGAFPPSSNHSRAVNMLFGDGHVVMIADAIDVIPWRALGSRDGGD